MSKNANTEIMIEIMSDNTEKLQKITKEQVNLVQEFSSAVDRASKLEIEPRTERLQEIIAHWNQLFTVQKNQIQELQNNQNNENKKQKLGTYLLLILTVILLLSVLLILIFKRI
ncbi:hypothetical protein [Flavobacterium collinsii]|uniref:Uncharacterized protein n=1 Tax=Flavobacterium collinsii TaxID=1114861 RepID=A0ABN7ER31_9FLAO|nr:hypothetical protein [Flavobacterium collinsii]CAA9202220.1 hypothetical protein FLACOL7796_04159 [Flavobacterium collinsii]